MTSVVAAGYWAGLGDNERQTGGIPLAETHSLHTSPSVVKEEENMSQATRKGRNVHVHSRLVPRDIPLGLTPTWYPWPPSQEATAGAECCCPVLGATHSCCTQTVLPCAPVAGFPELSLSSKRPLPDPRVREAAKESPTGIGDWLMGTD